MSEDYLFPHPDHHAACIMDLVTPDFDTQQPRKTKRKKKVQHEQTY
ncbi:MAG: hypothetical protein ABSD92_11835 [Candidatus Bathyarchaeia archaeon]